MVIGGVAAAQSIGGLNTVLAGQLAA